MKNEKVILSDPHLNLFNSYQRGESEKLEYKSRYEDNITRSLIISLYHLQPFLQNKIINLLVGGKNNEREQETYNYDLQNLNSKIEKELVKYAKEKILLLISREKFDLEELELNYEIIRKSEQVLSQLKDNDKLRKKLLNKYIFNKINNKNDTFIDLQEMIEIPADKIESFYNLTHNCRPDAWIYNSSRAILIEAKVGNNSHSKEQILRHITDANGFALDIKDYKRVKIISTTWDEIIEYFQIAFDSIKDEVKKPGDDFLKNQFKEFLIMSGEVLNLSFIIQKDLGYNFSAMKKQFPLLMEKLDRTLEINKLTKLKRGNRKTSDPIWDYYGFLNEKDEPQLDPHYTIIYFHNYSQIYLTTKKRNQMLKILKSNELKNYLNSIFDNNNETLRMHFIELTSYRLIDKKIGQRKGETQTTFNFKINLSELKNNKRFQTKIYDDLIGYSKFAKQLSIGIEIIYPNVEKITEQSSLRKINKELFEDYNKLLELYTNFFLRTNHLLDIMKN